MTRLIDSSLEKLSTIMSDMGEMAIQCISLATDSYLQGSSNSDKVHDLSDQIRQKYFQVEDLIFDMMLKYQPVAEDFRMIRSCTEISYAYSRFGRYAYDITQLREVFGNVSDCKNTSLLEISKKVKRMIQDAVLSFAELDIRKPQRAPWSKTKRHTRRISKKKCHKPQTTARRILAILCESRSVFA